jgi:hypothetical protein
LTTALLVACVAAALLMAGLSFRPLAAGAVKALAATLARVRAGIAERTRLRVAAALLDLGHHLMLCDEERRARRLRRLLHRAARTGRNPEEVLRRLGGVEADEVTVEAPVGSRPQEGNPTRTLHLSCVLHRPPEGPPAGRVGERRAPEVAWRVTNRPSAGHRGPTTYSEVPTLERALLSYHAPVLRTPAAGGRFFDEGVHDHPAA